MPDNMSRTDRYRRKMRRRYARRRTQSMVMATGGAVVLALTCVSAFASFSGIDMADAAIAKGKSLIELMSQRSPGKRTEAELTKTKGKHKYYRVLAEKAPPEMEVPGLYNPLVDVSAPPPVLYAAMPQLPGFSFPTNPLVPPGTGFPCCSIFVPPAPPGPPPPPPPPPPPVPEPGTWMTMIVGFGFVGWQLRRRRVRFEPARL